MINPPHLPVKAKRVIHLCMAGGPSQFETSTTSRSSRSSHGKPFPESFTKGQQLAQLQNTTLTARGPFVRVPASTASRARRSPTCSRTSPGIADEICIVRSMTTEQINHDPAHAFMNSGSIIKGRPSMGSWLLYGLGAETDDLPGFIVLHLGRGDGRSSRSRPGSGRPASCPASSRASSSSRRATPSTTSATPTASCQSTQRQVVEEINRLNGMLAEDRLDPEIQTRIAQYELAFRMQASRPRADRLRQRAEETSSTCTASRQPGDGSFASNCLMARRLAERGVRFIQLYHRAWDHHGDIEHDMPIGRARGRPGLRRAGQGPEAARACSTTR